MALRAPLACVVVVRHGSTDRNRGGVGLDQVRGHADIPMTDGGRREVMVTASVLADEVPRLEVIHTSDLVRATETAGLIADEQGEPWPQIVATPLLRSWDMGPSMEGRVTTPEVVDQIREWVRNDTVTPAGGESFRTFVGRVLGYVEPLFEVAARERSVLAIVAHGRVVQVVDFWVAAGCDEECMRRDFAEQLAEEPDTVPPGGAVRYRWDGLGWVGIVIPTGDASIGTRAAGGDHESSTGDGVIVS